MAEALRPLLWPYFVGSMIGSTLLVRASPYWLDASGSSRRATGHALEARRTGDALMRISHSLWRKLVVTLVAVVRVRPALPGDHPRLEVRRAPGAAARGHGRARRRAPASASRPRPTARATVTASGVRAANRDRGRRSRRCCRPGRSSRSRRPGEQYDGIYTIMDTGPVVQGPPDRHLHVELQRGAALRPPVASTSSSCASAGTRGPPRPSLIDTLLPWRDSRKPAPPAAAPRPKPSHRPAAVPEPVARLPARLRLGAAVAPHGCSVPAEARAAEPSAARRTPRSPGPCTAAGRAGSRCRAGRAVPGGAPDSRSSPLCRTRILSMSWIVDSRCAIAIVVRPAISTLQRVADQQLGLGVHARRRLVEHEDRAGRTRAPARTTAAASARPTASRRARRPRSSRPPRQPVDEAGRRAPPRAARRTASSSIAVVAEPDVAGDRAREQVDVLQHEAEQRRAGRRGPSRGCRRRPRGSARG